MRILIIYISGSRCFQEKIANSYEVMQTITTWIKTLDICIVLYLLRTLTGRET